MRTSIDRSFRRIAGVVTVTSAVLLVGWLALTVPVWAGALGEAETSAVSLDGGTWVRTVMTVAHKQIPLPPGLWAVAGRGDETLTDPLPGAYGVIESIALLKIEGGRVNSFITIHVNALPVDRGWGINDECVTANPDLIRIYDDHDPDFFCGFGGPVHVRRDAAAPKFWLQAVDMIHARGWTLPDRWLMSGFRISDRHDVVEVRYYDQLAPIPLAAPPRQQSGVILASWLGAVGGSSGGAISGSRGAGGQAVDPSQPPPWLAALSAWSDRMKGAIEQGFKGRLSDTQDIPALPSEAPASKHKVEESPETNQNTNPLLDLFQKSVIKMLSWKVIGISSGLTIKYLFIGNISTAATLQVATSVTTGVLYVGYDMLWEMLFPDKPKMRINFSSVAVRS